MTERQHLISREQFAALIAKGETVDGLGIRKTHVAEITPSGPPDSRAISVVISTESPDRDGDVVMADGWDLKSYLASPVVLWAHDYKGLPVARALSVSASNGKLRAVDEFAPKDVHPFADTVYQLIKGGFINATSVGFVPKEFEPMAEGKGYTIKHQELLEHSWVPVPANPEALVEARSLGVDLLPLKEWAERVLDEWHQEDGIWLPRKMVEHAFKVIEGNRVVVPAAAMDPAEVAALVKAGLAANGITESDPADQLLDESDEMVVSCMPTVRVAAKNPPVVLTGGLTAHEAGRKFSKDEFLAFLTKYADALEETAEPIAQADGDSEVTDTITEPEPTPAAPAPTTDPIEGDEAAPKGLVFEFDEPDIVALDFFEFDDEPTRDDLIEVDEAMLAGAIGTAMREALGPRWTALTGKLD